MQKEIVNNDAITAKIDFSMIHPVFHLDIKKDNCPLSLYKYIKYVLLEDALVTLGSLGFRTVFSIIPKGDNKLLKFQEKMGFEVETIKNGYIILAQDTY